MVKEIERITGGQAEIGSFHVVPFHLQAEIRNITVHGKEAPTDVPLLHADSVVGQVKVISFLRTQFGFQSLILERPVVHVVVGPDGSTNIPALRQLPAASGPSPVEQLFALSIDHLSVRNGELQWADQKIPLNFDVRTANVEMDYSFLRGRYESHLALGKVDTAIQDLRPFSWMTTIEFSLAPTFADIKSLKWSSGRSSIKASGRITNFGDPHLDGKLRCKDPSWGTSGHRATKRLARRKRRVQGERTLVLERIHDLGSDGHARHGLAKRTVCPQKGQCIRRLLSQ